MAPGRGSCIELEDSDEDDHVVVHSNRPAHPLFKPRDKTSRVATKGSIVDLTDDRDHVNSDIALSRRPRPKSPPSKNSLAPTYQANRYSFSHKGYASSATPKAPSAMHISSDSEDELPDDPTPKSSFSRTAPSSNLDRRPKAGLSSSSHNPSNTSSPKKRARDEIDATRNHQSFEKRRRTTALDYGHNAAPSPVVRSEHRGPPRRETYQRSTSIVAADDDSTGAGASDPSRVHTAKSAYGSKDPTSIKSDSVTRHPGFYRDDKHLERREPRREPQKPIPLHSLRESVSQYNCGDALEKTATGPSSPAAATSHRLSNPLSDVLDTSEHGHGSSRQASKKRRKEKGKRPDSTSHRDIELEISKTQNHASPSRQPPVAEETSAGAAPSPSLSPSSQLQREAGEDSQIPDRSVHVPVELEAIGGNPTLPGSEEVPTSFVTDKPDIDALPIFPVERQVERVLGKYYQEMREDTDYFTKAWLKRSRRSVELHNSRISTPCVNGSQAKSTSMASAIFARLRAATSTQPTSATAKVGNDHVRFSMDVYNGTNKSTRSHIKAKPIYCDISPMNNDVPEYAHYVSLNTNLLAPNTTTMTVWPYFGDGEPDPEEFDNYYRMDTDQRHRKIRRLLEAQKVEEYIESALQDLEITWDDILNFLLEQNPDVGTNKVAQTAVLNRNLHQEDFPEVQDSKKWKKVLSLLSASSQDRLIKAAILCDNFQRMAKFPLWHVARRSETVKQAFQAQKTLGCSLESRICRVCLQFNCHQHGELRETHSEDDSGAEEDDAVTKDILYPLKVNFRKRVSLPQELPRGHEENAISSSTTKKKNPKYWQTPDYTEPGEWPPFYPCNHPGRTCESEECSCFVNNRPCEKSCGCTADCRRKFQGCSCASFKHRKPGDYVCWRDDRCACYKIGRECDPDLCGTCGVCEVLDPVHRHDHNAIDTMRMCHNASIQRGVPKHTLLGDSGIHGMGLYAGQHIKGHEFVGEYKGEVITKEEADRRGAVYEKQKSTYLFSLNKQQEVDSNFYGNKIRFINHRNNTGANVYPLIMLVNTVHRIGLFAQQDIKPGEELFFDYGPKFPEHLLGGAESAIISKSAPHVRNANMVLNDFYDVEDDEDEAGNRRARKATSNGKNRGRPRKPEPTAKPVKAKGKMGGARPGAGRKPGKKKQQEAARAAASSGRKVVEAEAAPDGPRNTSQDRFEAYYISENKDLGVNGDDGDDEDFVDDEPSEAESSEEEEHSDDEQELAGRSRYGRVRGQPGRMKS